MDIYPVVLILWLHFLGDFVFQSDEVAKQKSSDNGVLLQHVILYALPLLIIGWLFALINAAIHYGVDFITSRMTSWLWQNELRHWFFIVIGLDQAIHLTCLYLTYYWLYS